MKVVHSFNSKEIIWKEQFYAMLLSALYARKHYGNISLYCSGIQKDQIDSIGPIYDSIDTSLYTSETYNAYSYPKLKSYLAQKENFLHLDHDTIIFKKINFDKIKSPVIFSHPEIKSFVKSKGDLNYHLGLILGNNNKDYSYLNSAYLDIIKDATIPENIINNLDFTSLPNMNIVYVDDVESFKDSVAKALDHYLLNKDLIDKHPFGAHHIEQFFIHQHLLQNNLSYKHAVKKNRTFLQKKVPLSISIKDQNSFNSFISKTVFPVKFKTYSKCICCGNKKTIKYKLNKPEDISNLFGMHFNGFLHLSFLQWSQLWQTYLIHEIVSEFGEELIIKAHKYFKGYYKNSNLPTISEGELLYEKITGKNLFSSL